MSERKIIAYDNGSTSTIIEATTSNAITGLMHPAVVGIENPIAGQEKGGYLGDLGGDLGYVATAFSHAPDDEGVRRGGIEIKPPMKAEHITGLAELMVAKQIVFPTPAETNFYRRTDEGDAFVTTVAPAQTRRSLEEIEADMAGARTRLEEQTLRLIGVRNPEDFQAQREYELAAGHLAVVPTPTRQVA